MSVRGTKPPAGPPRGVSRRVLLAALASLPAAAAGLLRPTALRAEPSVYEQERISREAQEAFQNVINLWREEVYFELYDHGTAASRQRIGREAFAQRMVELRWIPEGPLNERRVETTFHFRTLVYVTAEVRYREKFNPQRSFAKRHTLAMLRENGDWHVDLVALLRAPYTA